MNAHRSERYESKRRFVRNRIRDLQTAAELARFKISVEGKVLPPSYTKSNFSSYKGKPHPQTETGIFSLPSVADVIFSPRGEGALTRTDYFFLDDSVDIPGTWSKKMERVREGAFRRYTPKSSGNKERG